MNDVEFLASLLSEFKFRRSREIDLQDGVQQVLLGEDIAFHREHRFDPANRVDFWLPRCGVALEIKIKGSLTNVTLQLSRYAQFPEVKGLLLLTTRISHISVPRRIKDKPVVVEIVRVGL
ncbi:MAG: hypothetical protein LUE17_05870 [Planctomycetaceae bacterium]|nr:hypothetical protein [Planctomycetaceae bacterium]